MFCVIAIMNPTKTINTGRTHRQMGIIRQRRTVKNNLPSLSAASRQTGD
ncbi:hypothetical protein CLOM621_07792 [Clostridium sp. M62/1]|nr:hypothetical protein CLOM621_07792 [Clostridium sp. M62/1]